MTITSFRSIALAALLGVCASANAGPTLFDITGYAGTEAYRDTGHEAAQLTDTDGLDDTASAVLLLEFGSYAPTVSFGIYEYAATDLGVTLGETLEVFGPTHPLRWGAVVEFDLAAGQASVGDRTANIDETFGFYINVGATGHTYYSHAGLNSDGFDHMLMFNTSDNNAAGPLLGSNLVLAWEDLHGGGDMNFGDLVVGMDDVAPVPEPGTMALLGLSLLALGGVRRRARA